jgi:hypothetical protein
MRRNVGVKRLELLTSRSQTERSTNWATPRLSSQRVFIKFIFFSLRQPFISFSLLAACILFPNFSQYTSFTGNLDFCKQVFNHDYVQKHVFVNSKLSPYKIIHLCTLKI